MLRFRPPGDADFSALRDLAERIWSASYAEMISRGQMDYMLALGYSEEAIRAEMAAGVQWEIAVLEEMDVGYLSLTCGADGVAKLNKLYLLPELQGRGLGQEMLERVFALTAGSGPREIRLQVNKRNLRAQRAYERAGFAIIEAATFDIGGGYVMDDYVMARAI